MVKTIDYERSTLVCTKCGLCEYYPVYVESYNHTMQPSRRKCIYVPDQVGTLAQDATIPNMGWPNKELTTLSLIRPKIP